MSKTTGLGRGFDTLIPQNFDSNILADSKDRIQKLFIKQVSPNSEQPRRHFDEQALQELAASIKRYGVLQPIIVSKAKNDTYVIVAGERRWRAAQLAKLDQIPTIVRDQKELEQLEIALIENVQRVDLSPLEQAASIEKLHQQFSMSYKDIAERLGKAATTINNIVRLLQLPDKAREALQTGQISEGHARAILALKDLPNQQHELLNEIEKRHWSVRQAEQFVTACKAGLASKPAMHKRLSAQTPETKQLTKMLGTPVTVKRTAKGGRIEIHFGSDEQLAQLLNQLSK